MTTSKLFFESASGATAIVDTGFSWAAFILGPLWAISKRQWLMFLLLCIAQLPFTIVFALAEQKEDTALFALSLLLALVYMAGCGAFGNRLHRHFLERKGYAFKDFV